jgi:hypothetical protein
MCGGVLSSLFDRPHYLNLSSHPALSIAHARFPSSEEFTPPAWACGNSKCCSMRLKIMFDRSIQ